LTGLIQAIRFDKGQNHDFEIYKNSEFDLSDELEISADSGFQGIQNRTAEAVTFKSTNARKILKTTPA